MKSFRSRRINDSKSNLVSIYKTHCGATRVQSSNEINHVYFMTEKWHKGY